MYVDCGMTKSYIRDIDIRNTLKEDILKKYIDDQNSRVVEEMGIMWGEGRVDISVINGELHAL